MKLVVPNRDRLNLLGCFLEKIILKNCSNPEKKPFTLIKHSITLLIIGGKMKAYLTLDGGIITLSSNEEIKPNIIVKSNLNTFLDIALGKNLVLIYLLGKMQIKGNILKIIPFLKWLII